MYRTGGGLAATFDLTAYKDYMIARVKKKSITRNE